MWVSLSSANPAARATLSGLCSAHDGGEKINPPRLTHHRADSTSARVQSQTFFLVLKCHAELIHRNVAPRGKTTLWETSCSVCCEALLSLASGRGMAKEFPQGRCSEERSRPCPWRRPPALRRSIHTAHESWRRVSGPQSTGATWGTQPPKKQPAPPKPAGARAHGQGHSRDGPELNKPKARGVTAGMGMAEPARVPQHSPCTPQHSPREHPSLPSIHDHQDLRADFTSCPALTIYLKPHTGEENVTKQHQQHMNCTGRPPLKVTKASLNPALKAKHIRRQHQKRGYGPLILL